MTVEVADTDNPYQIYQTLKESFEGTGMDNGIKLVARLNKISNFTGLNFVVSNFVQLNYEFTNHFHFKKDDFWVAYTLRSLRHQYDQLRVALKTKDKLTSDQLQTFLNQESLREQQNSSTLTKTSTRPNESCLICGKTNHLTENCWKKKIEPVTNSNNNGHKNNKNKNKAKKKDDGRQFSANLIKKTNTNWTS